MKCCNVLLWSYAAITEFYISLSLSVSVSLLHIGPGARPHLLELLPHRVLLHRSVGGRLLWALRGVLSSWRGAGGEELW